MPLDTKIKSSIKEATGIAAKIAKITNHLLSLRNNIKATVIKPIGCTVIRITDTSPNNTFDETIVRYIEKNKINENLL